MREDLLFGACLHGDKAHLSGQSPHDGESGHVQGNTCASSELAVVHLASAPHHIPGTAAGFDNDCTCTSLTSLSQSEVAAMHCVCAVPVRFAQGYCLLA